MPVSNCCTRATQPVEPFTDCQLNWYVPAVGVLAWKFDLPEAREEIVSVAVFTVSLGQVTPNVPKNTQGADGGGVRGVWPGGEPSLQVIPSVFSVTHQLRFVSALPSPANCCHIIGTLDPALITLILVSTTGD